VARFVFEGRLPISVASSRSCSLIQWRILLFAERFYEAEPIAAGVVALLRENLNESPLVISWRSDHHLPFTFAPTHWCPTSV